MKEFIRIIASKDYMIQDIYEIPYYLNKNGLPSSMILRVIKQFKSEYPNSKYEIEFKTYEN